MTYASSHIKYINFKADRVTAGRYKSSLSAATRVELAATHALHRRYIVMKHNEHELPQLPEFAKANQFDLLKIRTLSIIDVTEDVHRSLIPITEKYSANSYIEDWRTDPDDFIWEKAFTLPAVFADGTGVVCAQDCNAQEPCGRLADGLSFADVWLSTQAAEVRKSV